MSEEYTITQAARDFVKYLKDIKVPEGDTLDHIMLDENAPDISSMSGGMQLMKAVGVFIELNQDMDALDANAKVTQRLAGKTPDGDTTKHIGAIIGEMTFVDGEELAALERTLRAAVEVDRGENLFDATSRAVRNISRDNDLKLDDNMTMEYGDRASQRGNSDEERKKDEGTWRESTHRADDEGPQISDEDVKRAAEEHDKSGGTVDEEAIRRSAERDVKDISSSNTNSEYEAIERARGGDYLHEQYAKHREIRNYARVADTLRTVYHQTVGKALEATKAPDREVS